MVTPELAEELEACAVCCTPEPYVSIPLELRDRIIAALKGEGRERWCGMCEMPLARDGGCYNPTCCEPQKPPLTFEGEGRDVVIEQLSRDLALTELANIEGASSEWLDGFRFAAERVRALKATSDD